MTAYEIVTLEKEEMNDAWGVIGGGINDYNEQHGGPERGKRLCFGLRLPGEKEIAGGVIGYMYWDWLYVDLMWLKEDLRKQGYGSRLLAMLEEAARQLGARHAHLDTFDFQAPGFYQKHGYRVFGELKDCPPGHTRYYMTKEL